MKCVYIVDSSNWNFSFSFLVESSVAIGKSKFNNGHTIARNRFSKDNIFVKYHDDSVHNLFTTSCWSTFQSKVDILVVRNTHNAYLNCVETIFLSSFSLGNWIKCLYFLKIWIIHIAIQIATQIIHDNANNETLKLAKIQNKIEKIKTENWLQNCINQELKVSWNATKIELLTWIRLYHKK